MGTNPLRVVGAAGSPAHSSDESAEKPSVVGGEQRHQRGECVDDGGIEALPASFVNDADRRVC